MTIISTRLGDELEAALERYLEAHPDTPETIMKKALKRFLLEEGFPAEDEALTNKELAALAEFKQGKSAYMSWEEVEQNL